MHGLVKSILRSHSPLHQITKAQLISEAQNSCLKLKKKLISNLIWNYLERQTAQSLFQSLRLVTMVSQFQVGLLTIAASLKLVEQLHQLTKPPTTRFTLNLRGQTESRSLFKSPLQFKSRMLK
jgi:hypothetical protein